MRILLIDQAPKDGSVIWALLPSGGGFRARWDHDARRWATWFGADVWKPLDPQPIYFDADYVGSES